MARRNPLSCTAQNPSHSLSTGETCMLNIREAATRAWARLVYDAYNRYHDHRQVSASVALWPCLLWRHAERSLTRHGHWWCTTTLRHYLFSSFRSHLSWSLHNMIASVVNIRTHLIHRWNNCDRSRTFDVAQNIINLCVPRLRPETMLFWSQG